MSDGLKVFCFILLLPFLGAIGHDIYTNYLSDDEKLEQVENLNIQPEDFQLSDVGYLWVTYAPKSHDAARENISVTTWKNFIEPILRMPTVIVAATPAIIGYLVLIALWVIGVWPFQRSAKFKGKGGGEFDVYSRHNKGKIDYKRK